MVGKLIPVVPGFTASQFKDLNAVTIRWGHQLGLDIICLAGGYPSMTNELFRSPNDRITSDVVIGIKVSEVDYTSPNQPFFSIEKLHNFYSTSKLLHEEMWYEISRKPYVSESEFHQTSTSLYVVSTYPNAFVNVVFGVRKQGANGKGSQVVGISCHQPESHVCKLDIDERIHMQRVQLMGGVEGIPYYHLLPELFK